MKKVVLIIALFLSCISFAQESYKYIIIPSQFSFFTETNKYGLNELTKSFFQSEGLEVYYDNEKFPDELSKNRCLTLYANAVESNTMFLTKIHFEIKDCTNKVLLKSELATSREKQYKVAYTQTFRQALSSLKGKINFKNVDAIEKIEVVETPKEVVEVSKNEIISNTGAANTLFAIPIVNGYKLVNDKPETIFILKKTSADNIFIAQKDSKSGVLMKKSSGWFFEYYEGDKLFSEKVEVKF
ncbi:hypothetical protein [Flavobacterium sp.]|uniref:hypothetical protein n=1 Tax=Flavobacterium sp. TaxID=239 RepID=UPI0008CE8FFA|nr:hypothetical protein [Flavobacterium sp.]OGS62620.1 MAG: hypothetical protein A2X07_10575 [Flavobacteria bacterium GWF1_32_7]HBD25227.1 hypothetical protein [Flavobacterium sp.]